MGLWSTQRRQRVQYVGTNRVSAVGSGSIFFLIFFSFIVIASSNEYTRKIFNSPMFAEPCLVASAKQVLLKENW
jgi:hypothetical protein